MLWPLEMVFLLGELNNDKKIENFRLHYSDSKIKIVFKPISIMFENRICIHVFSCNLAKKRKKSTLLKKCWLAYLNKFLGSIIYFFVPVYAYLTYARVWLEYRKNLCVCLVTSWSKEQKVRTQCTIELKSK